MVSFRTLAGILAPVFLLTPAAVSAPLELKAVALVESRAPSWKAVPESARIDVQGLSFKRKFFLEGRSAIPVRAPEVRKALAEALKPLSKGDRSVTREVLKAVEEWTATSLTESVGPLACPSAWLPADQVLKNRAGNRFELVRAVTAMLRAAGIPARPSFNGLPMVCIFVVPARGNGFWTVWDPFHPGASLARLPVLWLPLRAEEVALAATKPETGCEPLVEGRRYPRREDALAAFASMKATGAFPPGAIEPLSADAGTWWEVWAVGAKIDAVPEKKTSVSFPLPFVIEPASRCGTRDWAVWISEPARMKGRPSAHTRTDQQLGGILMEVRVDLKPAPVSATTGA
jgi:hypothetical protein